MEYRIIRSNNELYHHGIKGQKWGVRRYQNADGSLTWLGRRRYNRDADFKKSVDRNRALQKAREARELKKQQAEIKAKILKSSDPEYLYKNRHLLTTEELNERINRIDAENRLKGKIPEKESKIDIVTKRINKTACLFSELDKAYKTVSGSSIGSSVAKLLGIETKKKKPFNLDDFVKNMDNKSDQEIKDAAARIKNMNNINNYYKTHQANKTTDNQTANSNDTSSNKVSAYNINGRADKDDMPHVKNATWNNKTSSNNGANTNRDGTAHAVKGQKRGTRSYQNNDTYSGTVEGNGTSRYERPDSTWDDNPVWRDATPSSSSYKRKERIGYNYMQYMLEDKD